ncbi:unnamed protein product [Chilo suppressalis]|uniref:PEST proteolytic signal-containing nuclear protein n=1 Tax=Chilo suppressalis TaxID=168631 RepID=A0ABN8L2Y0_CHISP|nr:hypothetical protein evm_008201 [Chilo suppressalis]CAH2983893.1 unnamed protein product [Chilo suppressalis]
MSKRYSEYRDYKGSSRAPRDDSRTHKDEAWSSRDHERRRSRSRSRSPRRSSDTRNRYSPDSSDKVGRSSSNRDMDLKHKYEDKKVRLSPNEWEDSDEEVPAPPPPPRITKISMGFAKPKEPIKMTLSGASKPAASRPKPSVASVFNDDDDEPEEMPAEARMRMRNIGRETPTSAGPNSFGKTKQGFCDAKKVFEKNLKEALETTQTARPMGKFPQTIYRIKGP